MCPAVREQLVGARQAQRASGRTLLCVRFAIGKEHLRTMEALLQITCADGK
jgi:hypothetical protein